MKETLFDQVLSWTAIDVLALLRAYSGMTTLV
jgi:hypothetical protein